MPLPLPNLDARRFDDLVAEMRALIPNYAPEWTNHNPSDPGMTLVELLAWITETTLYRLNRIPEPTYRKFIALLLGEPPQPSESLESAKLRAVQFFNGPYRAVTAADFEREAKRANPDVARVRVLSNAAEGRVTVVVVPTSATLEYEAKQPLMVKEGEITAVFVPKSVTGMTPTDASLGAVKNRLNERRLVGTRVQVRGAIYTKIELGITVVRESNTIAGEVVNTIEEAIVKYLQPIKAGPDENGWPFGRPLSVFELYHLIEPIPGVDHVEKIVMKENGTIREKEIEVEDLPMLQSLTVEVVSL